MLRPPEGSPIPDLAAQLGLRADVSFPNFGLPSPALFGRFAGISAVLKAHGGRWDAKNRCMKFGNWPAVEVALQAAVAERGRAEAGGSPV